MEKFEVGMLARSKAGHDSGRIYVISKIEAAYVYLVDGEIRTLQNPKKKKNKHVQIILEKHELTDIDDVGVKRILKLYRKESKQQALL